MDGIAFDIAHLLAGGLVLTSFMLLYQDRLYAMLNIFALHALVLAQYDRMIGLELGDVAVDGCITKAPGGGACAGRSPVDRGKQGLKRSVLVDGTGVPLAVIATGANRHDSPLLAETLAGLEAWSGEAADTTVHPEITKRFGEALCAQGVRVSFVPLPGVSHTFAARDSAAAALNWMTERFRGAPAPSSCER